MTESNKVYSMEEWRLREDSNYEAIRIRDAITKGSNKTPKKKKRRK